MKRFALPLTLFAIALILLGGVLLISKCSNSRPKGKDAAFVPAKDLPLSVPKNDPPPKIIVVDTDRRTHIVWENLPEAATPDIAGYIRDTLAPVLGQIVEYKQLTAKLEGQVAFYKAELDKANNEKRYYKGRYMSIVVANRAGLPPDSSTASYSYDADLRFVDYAQRKNIFSRKRYYTDIFSPDTAFRISGLKRYKREVPIPRTYLKLAAYGEARIGFGSGYRFQRADVGLELEGNTDGVFSPYIRAGYGADSNFSFSPSLQVGGKVNLLRVKF